MLYTNGEVKRILKQRHKQINKDARKQLEIEASKQERMYSLLLKEEKRENDQMKERHEIHTRKAYELLNRHSNILTYREYLTMRDILFSDYVQVGSDLNKNKITVEQVREIVKILNNNDFDISIEKIMTSF